MANEIIYIVNSKSLIPIEMQKFLESKSYQVKAIGEFEEVVEALNEERPDLIIFEIISLTPVIVENIEELKRMPQLSGIPNMAVLNRATRNLVLFLAQMGIKDILVKPFAKEALLATLDKIIAPVESGSFHIKRNSNPENYSIIKILNELNISNSNELDQIVKQLLSSSFKKIILDFRRVAHIDNSGVGILVLCKKRADINGGQLKIGNLNDHVKDVIQALQLDEYLDISDNINDLIDSSNNSGETIEVEASNENVEEVE